MTNKYFYLVIGALLILTGIGIYKLVVHYHVQSKCRPGTIILLNGPSAAGKSSLQKKLQELFKEPYLKIGIDNFFVGVLPERYFQGPIVGEPEESMVMKLITSQDEEGNPVLTLQIGPAGQRVISGMHAAIGSYARSGNNIIVDYILYYQLWIADLVRELKGLRVYMIGINPSLSMLEERERIRATSPVGHARSHYITVHEAMIYDLELDTTHMTVEEAALKIKEFVEQNPEPAAFNALARRGSII